MRERERKVTGFKTRAKGGEKWSSSNM